MKKMKQNKYSLLILFVLFVLSSFSAAAQKDSVTAEEVVKLKYYSENNSMQYLLVETMLKKGKKLEPLNNKSFQLYLDSVANENLIGRITTDATGKAKSFLPVGLKQKWDAVPQHTLIAVAVGKENEIAAELEITKAKIEIDTSAADGARSITVSVKKYENGEWVPVNEVELKAGIQRLGSILSAGDEATYTTDSTGTVTIEVTRDSLPGDAKGNIILAAKVEDNDLVGNLLIEKTVAWGVPTVYDNNFFKHRTLWSTRFKTPYWLLLMAYSIVISVWGTLIYLVFQLIKIKKLGKAGS
jgi:hypothetical protein